jgi:hypothetical protein
LAAVGSNGLPTLQASIFSAILSQQAKPEFVRLVEMHYVLGLETAIVPNTINELDRQAATEMLDMSRAFGRASLEVGMAVDALKVAIG